MLATILDTPSRSLLYERAFLRTVLSLRGASRAPTEHELADARNTFELYGAGMEKLKPMGGRPDSWLKGRLAEPAAVEHAFMFVKFHSLLPPNAGQLRAFHDWLSTGKHP
jgi:hypothetical protein